MNMSCLTMFISVLQRRYSIMIDFLFFCKTQRYIPSIHVVWQYSNRFWSCVYSISWNALRCYDQISFIPLRPLSSPPAQNTLEEKVSWGMNLRSSPPMSFEKVVMIEEARNHWKTFENRPMPPLCLWTCEQQACFTTEASFRMSLLIQRSCQPFKFPSEEK